MSLNLLLKLLPVPRLNSGIRLIFEKEKSVQHLPVISFFIEKVILEFLNIETWKFLGSPSKEDKFDTSCMG